MILAAASPKTGSKICSFVQHVSKQFCRFLEFALFILLYPNTRVMDMCESQRLHGFSSVAVYVHAMHMVGLRAGWSHVCIIMTYACIWEIHTCICNPEEPSTQFEKDGVQEGKGPVQNVCRASLLSCVDMHHARAPTIFINQCFQSVIQLVAILHIQSQISLPLRMVIRVIQMLKVIYSFCAFKFMYTYINFVVIDSFYRIFLSSHMSFFSIIYLLHPL